MLNISKNKIDDYIDQKKYRTLNYTSQLKSAKRLKRFLIWFTIIMVLCLFLPWTQNVRTTGTVTTLRPEQKPQKLQAAISGQIQKWYIREGDYVQKGDTLLRISEIKSEYLDPNLVTNTQDQVNAKSASVDFYGQKTQALSSQISALVNNKKLKVQAAENKIIQANLQIKIDSIELEASQTNIDIAKAQFDRIDKLYQAGLKSKTDFEDKKLKLQKAKASLNEKQNKFLASKNKLLNAQVDLSAIKAEYDNKIAKASADKFSNESSRFNAQAEVRKLENNLANYSARNSMYYILAPQDGYVTKTISSGIGETLKEGQSILTIMPKNFDLAVETYVRPIDLPLMNKEQEVRLQFDGWPAIVFSGWPNVSYGTFGGKIFAVDNFISENGKYRILIAPDTSEYHWPQALRVGSATNGMILLNNVSIWYELWRQINSFPPDFYKKEEKAALKK